MSLASLETSSPEINFVALEYEFEDAEIILEKNIFKFIRKHKSLYYPHSYEWDVTITNTISSSNVNMHNIFIMRTCICKLVYFNKSTNKVILQISEYSIQNTLKVKFIDFVDKLEMKYNVDAEFKLLKKDSKYNNYSIIIEYDPEGFTWFERNGKVKDHLNISSNEKMNVVCMLYLDKKIHKNVDTPQYKQTIGFRWMLFQVREVFLRPQKCMIRLSSDNENLKEGNGESTIKEENFFVPFSSFNASYMSPIFNQPPPPPPPPPLPPVFKIRTPIIKKNEIINKIKKDSNLQFVVSKDELMQVMKKMKSREIL